MTDKIKVSFDNSDNVLRIMKGVIPCRRLEHEITTVMGILPNLYGRRIEIEVNFCVTCNDYFLEYERYKNYRKRFGILLGNTPIFDNNIEIDSYWGKGDGYESILYMLGYSISKKKNLNTVERRRILGNIMDRNIVSKQRVIGILRYYTGPSKYGGIYKPKYAAWYEDLEWARGYEVDNKRKYLI